MRILFLTHSYNSLAQRLHIELAARGHEVSIEFDINDVVAEEAVALFEPQLVVAPFLKRAIPASIWQRLPCFVVHPGIVGDRGPSALDWAIQERQTQWGVTVLQAEAAMDAGPVWASRTFPMRAARKSSLYRNEVTEAAVAAVLEAVGHAERGGFVPRRVEPGQSGVHGRERALMRQGDRAIDWARDDTATVLAKLHAADGFPGVAAEFGGIGCWLYDGHADATLRARFADAMPGTPIARRLDALALATRDGAVWIGHARRRAADGAAPTFKLPFAQTLPELAAGLPELPVPALPWREAGTWQDIAYEEAGPAGEVGVLHFDFYNGAMSSVQCRRLREAFLAAAARPTRSIVLAGGADFWSNGIHLNAIEVADSPADASWDNIVAMDELCRAILECTSHLTLAAMQGNAGAGGVFLALAADRVLAREGIVLNPHYKGMGNLYGSEYWTYLLPARVGAEAAHAITQQRLPIGAAQAAAEGLVDAALPGSPAVFLEGVVAQAVAQAQGPQHGAALAAKRERRARDEAIKPLAAYRDEELARMRLNFYGFDPSYHVARYHFVHRVPHAWTPLHLAVHRRTMWRAQERLKTRDAA
ncbi:MAG: enoyl-CoA hydratase-related protein [Aquabacterium sp.]|nr:enoyl-CoA hydratase-related protein [Aquabacterium sp.]